MEFRVIFHITLLCVIVQLGLCLEFQVGDRAGWAVPPSNETALYNHWASQERFKVGDIVRFKYKKDSVMAVNETEYRDCNSTRPNFFSNKGDTIYTLNRSGFFYFISGAAGHCEKGQRIIIWVIGQDEAPVTLPAKSLASKNAIFVYGLLTLPVFLYFA